MQINGRTWLHRLQPYGISQHDLQYDPCINVKACCFFILIFYEKIDFFHRNQSVEIAYVSTVMNKEQG